MTNHGQIYKDFREKIDQGRLPEEIGQSFIDAVNQLGFEHVALCSHVDPMSPPAEAISVFKYPDTWLSHFSDQGYEEFDPVFVEASRRNLPFHWDDPAFRSNLAPRQKRVLQEGAEVGLKQGFTVPIYLPGAIAASCSLVSGPDSVDPLNYALAHSMAIYTHARIIHLMEKGFKKPVPLLTLRQREYLNLAAQGKSEWAISKILNVSEHAAHRALDRINKKLGVSTRVQAVALAVLSHQISTDF